MSAVASFKRLHPAYKTVISLVAPIATIIATLLGAQRDPAVQRGRPRGERRPDRRGRHGRRQRPVRERRRGRVPRRRGLRLPRGSRQPALRLQRHAGRRQRLRGVEAVFDGRQVYLRLAGGKQWIHADLDAAGEQMADYAEAEGKEPPADLVADPGSRPQRSVPGPRQAPPCQRGQRAGRGDDLRGGHDPLRRHRRSAGGGRAAARPSPPGSTAPPRPPARAQGRGVHHGHGVHRVRQARGGGGPGSRRRPGAAGRSSMLSLSPPGRRCPPPAR